MINKEKLLKIFIFSIFFIAVYIYCLLKDNYEKKIIKSDINISNVISKIKFGKSPLCGDEECWYKKDYDDKDWDIVPLPKYDYREHPEYNKGLKEGYVYHRIKIGKIENLDCNQDYYIPINVKDNILERNYTEKVVVHYNNDSSIYERDRIAFRLPVKCQYIKKSGGLIVIRVNLERWNVGIYYSDFSIRPNKYHLIYTEKNNFDIIGPDWPFFILLLFILIIYIFFRSFRSYEFFYLLNSTLKISQNSFYIADLFFFKLFRSPHLSSFVYIFLSFNLLKYIKINYINRYQTLKRSCLFGNFLLLVSVISYIFYYYNFHSWNMWNFINTTKTSYTIVNIFIIIKLLNLFFHQENKIYHELKEDIVFFILNLFLCILCIYDHIFFCEVLIFISGSLFFLYKKLSRIILSKKLHCANAKTLNEMNQYKNIGKVYSALTHDLKKPFTKVKYLLETDPISPIPSIDDEIDYIKKDIKEVEKSLELLLKVASNNSIERNIHTIKLFIESINKKNIVLLNKVHAKYESWTVSISREFIETLNLILKYSALNNANITINQISIHFKKYLQITLPIKISDNFDYIEENAQNKRAPAQLYLDTLDKSFIKKMIICHQDYSPYEENADDFKITDDKTILYLKMNK